MPVYLKIANPKVYTNRDVKVTPELVAELKAQGYDGILRDFSAGEDAHRYPSGEFEYAVFDPTQIKSATGNNGQFDPANPDIRKSEKRTPLGFYSALASGVDQIKTNAAPAQGWKDAIKGLVNKGLVKADEVEWSGIKDYLALQGKAKLSKDDLAAYLDDSGVKVSEVKLGKPNDKERFAQMLEIAKRDYGREYGELDHDEQVSVERDVEDDTSKYSQYTLPGGTNYREVLLTLPDVIDSHNRKIYEELEALGDGPDKSKRRAELVSLLKKSENSNYRSSHWDQPNILAHIRMNDRTDADGKRVLFIEEIQSDWGQEGKKRGFNSPYKKQVKPGEYEAFIADLKAKTVAHVMEKGVDRATAESLTRLGHDMMADMVGMRAEYNDLLRRQLADRDAEFKGGVIPSAPFVAARQYIVYKDGKELVTQNKEGKDVRHRYDKADAAQIAADKFGGTVRDMGMQANTEGWLNLALKRVMVMAAEGGYDKVAFINGEQSAERYDLSKQVKSIGYTPNGDGTYKLYANGMSNETIVDEKRADMDRIEALVGEEIATKIANGEGRPMQGSRPDTGFRSLTGLDLKVGGEGMKTFYDTIVPTALKKLLPKVGGGTMGSVDINVGDKEANENWRRMTANSSIPSTPLKESSTQPGFDVTDAMREKVAEGLPLFSEKRIFDDSGRTYTPEQKAFFQNVGRTQETPTIKERIENLRKDIGKKMAQGIADQFTPIKDLSKKAYALARLSKGAAGAVEALLKHGKLKLVDGVYDADTSGGALERVFMPLQNEVGDFLWWVAAHRAGELSQQDRENLFTPADIAAGKSLDQGTVNFNYTLRNGQVTRDRTLIFKDALKNYDEFNQNVLDMAEQSGLISSDVRKTLGAAMYVPFYRESEDGSAYGTGPSVSAALVRQNPFKKLKGGEQKLKPDLLQNVLMNWGNIIDASAKNRAGLETLKAAEQMGVAVEAPEAVVRDMGRSTGNKQGVVWVQDAGVKRYFLVDDPYVLAAISSLQYSGMKGPIMDAMGAFKQWLTVGVTASPAFKIRNLVRDSITAVATAPLSANLLENLRSGATSAYSKDQSFVSALAGGGLIRFNDMIEGNQSARVRQLVRMGTDKGTILDSDDKVQALRNRFEKAFMAYSEVGNISEEINRLALYKKLKSEGFSDAEANLAARDLLDFSMQGTWSTVRFLTQVVPFMNARIQGLYKLGRATKEDPARFGAVLGAVALASIALMAAYSDDDDWKKREDWDRNNFWWFKVGGVAYRIPKPFEIGAIATLAERGIEFAFNKDMTPARYGKIVKDMLLDNLSMNPIPQAFKPVMDIYANKNSFTGRPIETMGMERLKPDYRFNQGTSMLARGLSTAGQSVVEATGLDRTGVGFLSPVQIDAALQGYFSWLGSLAVGSSDMALRPLTGQPTRPTADYYKLATQGIAQEVDSGGSYYVSALYDQAKVLEQAHATWRDLLKQGKVAEAREFFAENKSDIIRYGAVERVKAAEAKFNEMIRMIERSAKDPDVKKAEIQRVRDQQDRMARLVTAAK